MSKPQWTNTATVRPNNAIAGQRTSSMPQLLSEPKESQSEMDGRGFSTHLVHPNHGTGQYYIN